jgi:hypothetical protein
MVLTPEEAEQLAALQAKEAEPAEDTRTLTITVPADVADVVSQLVQVHWASIAPAVGQAFLSAYADAKAAADAAEPEPEPEPAEPEPAEPAPAFGTEDESGTEPEPAQ